jgi:pseudaminic acid synthase
LASHIEIAGRRVGPGEPTYVVAELSGNHGQSYETAIELVHAAKTAGADAVKLQTYTADTMTIDGAGSDFVISGGLWSGRTLYDLYQEASTPWEWQANLKAEAESLGMHLFSTPFDRSAVDFLSNLSMPAYKIASFEVVDIPFLRYVARQGKPVIMSTGMATSQELGEAVEAIREEGNDQLLLLHAISAYPAPAEEMNLRTLPHLAETFGVPVGLSDHTLGIAGALAAVALGACVIEKHFTLSRAAKGVDSEFSLEPDELRELVEGVRTVEAALGGVREGPTAAEQQEITFRRSLFAVSDIEAGDSLTDQNVRSIRPGFGLAPKHLDVVLAKRAIHRIPRGTPLSWDLLTT